MWPEMVGRLKNAGKYAGNVSSGGIFRGGCCYGTCFFGLSVLHAVWLCRVRRILTPLSRPLTSVSLLLLSGQSKIWYVVLFVLRRLCGCDLKQENGSSHTQREFTLFHHRVLRSGKRLFYNRTSLPGITQKNRQHPQFYLRKLKQNHSFYNFISFMILIVTKTKLRLLLQARKYKHRYVHLCFI